jgi:beta-phosphoglucomutase-like phosphatase (HAD superfamily)
MSARPTPTTVLDLLRARIDPAAFDAAVFALEAVVADLGYGDVRPLPGSLAWIEKLRGDGIRIALTFAGDNAEAALRLAGIEDRFDAVVGGARGEQALRLVLDELGVAAERAVVVDVAADGLQQGRSAGCHLLIGVARGAAAPEALRRAGADAVVADLQELA